MNIKLLVALFWLNTGTCLISQPVPVQIIKDSLDQFTILREGEPYYIQGAGTTNLSLFDELASRGGNSIRTWGVNASSGKLLKEADKYGLTVILGLWMKKEKDGFDYNDETAVKNQLESFRTYVRSFRNYPALLAWSIGNEVDLGYSNYKVWNAVNDIANMIKEEDGNHPTLTITAGISSTKITAIAQRAPDLDMIGINSYGSIGSVYSTISNSIWNKPYLVTEWGVNGPWEAQKTSWGAPLEPNSTQKAEIFITRYMEHIAAHSKVLPGSYAFYWNSKFESTETWFGLFVNNHTTPMVDALEYCWKGDWPENKAPEITNLFINSKTQNNNVTISGRLGNKIEVAALDPEGDQLSYEFLVKPESGDELVESIPGAAFDAIPGLGGLSDSGTITLNFQDIHNKKNFRLYALVYDGNGHVGTATFPFRTDFSLNDSTLTSGDTENIVTDIITEGSIYPNPVKDFVYFNMLERSKEVKVYLVSSSGKRYAEEVIDNTVGNTFAIDLSDYTAGFYVIVLISKNTITSFRILKY